MTGQAEAVVFDVDGTLVDSERQGHRVAFNEAFAAFDLPYVWDEATYGGLLAITGGEERLRRFLLSRGHRERDAARLARALHRDKTERFQRRCVDGGVPARRGVRELLDDLASAEVPMAVATTGSREWVDPLLDRLFGLERFTVVLTGTEIARRKPAGDVYVAVCRELACHPGEVVAVEDSANGLMAAHDAGVPCLVVVNDYTRNDDVSTAALAVDGFCDATPLHGPPGLLDAGCVTAATLAAIPGVAGGVSPSDPLA